MAQLPDPFEFLKNLWGPMGVPLARAAPPALNEGELERRIAELRSVENWLNMNLNVLRATLQGLEMQKSALSALQATAKSQEDSAVASGVPADGRSSSEPPRSEPKK